MRVREPYVPQGAHQRFLIDDNVFLDKEFLIPPSILLDAFTTARYDVSIAVAPSSFASGINTLELAESLGLET